jgi:FAD synthase
MYLNREYVYRGGEYDPSKLFVTAERPPELAANEAEISSRVAEQLRILGQPSQVTVALGRAYGIELRVVPGVERFHTELQPAAFGEGEVLEQ